MTAYLDFKASYFVWFNDDGYRISTSTPVLKDLLLLTTADLYKNSSTLENLVNNYPHAITIQVDKPKDLLTIYPEYFL